MIYTRENFRRVFILSRSFLLLWNQKHLCINVIDSCFSKFLRKLGLCGVWQCLSPFALLSCIYDMTWDGDQKFWGPKSFSYSSQVWKFWRLGRYSEKLYVNMNLCEQIEGRRTSKFSCDYGRFSTGSSISMSSLVLSFLYDRRTS